MVPESLRLVSGRARQPASKCLLVTRRYKHNGAGRVQVEFMDTDAVLQLVDKPGIAELAVEVKQRLERVMAAM